VQPEVDAIFAATNPGRPVVESEDDALSPKFGALWRVSPTTTFSAQWASGFRAPPAADINIGLTNLPAGYTVIPNPDLKPERSHGIELGVRGRYPSFEYTLAAFDTRYKDLIVSRAPLPCPGDPRCVSGATGTFQSQNISKARIFGAEASALWRFAPSWAAQAAVSHAVGSDTGKDRPLNSVDPTRISAGLFFDRANYGAALHVTHALEKTKIDQSAGTLFATPSYTVVDLTASWQVTKQVRVSAGLFNLFDEKYWLWSDVRSVLNPNATIDRYTQPGRTASVLVRAQL
jgi:hemoglobin/transferrin/lactoferrin receptor protein